MDKELLTRNIEDIIVKSELEAKLASNQKLRIKFGIDPTSRAIHIGQAASLWKLKAWQALGHQIVIIIGDFTATIGDTSDKDSPRQPLSTKQVKNNLKDYLSQLGKIIDLSKAEVHYNSKWLNKLSLSQFFQLAEKFTISQMIERENFKNRLSANKPVGLHEILYPILQGYDSVKIKADVEIGGTDQLFNMLIGREIQKIYNQPEQSVLTLHLLEGTDGRKMSSSWNNCIFINDQPFLMYSKVMTIADELIPIYFKMATDLPMEQIEQIEKNLASGDNPRDSKASLAWHIVSRYWGEKKATLAQQAWERQFRKKQKPLKIPVLKTSPPADLIEVLSTGFTLSKSEARRILNQKGVKVDDRVATLANQPRLKNGSIIQLGKRRFVKIIFK